MNPMKSVKVLLIAPNAALFLLLQYLCVISSLWPVVGTVQNPRWFSDEEADCGPACNLKNHTTVFREYINTMLRTLF